MCCEDLNSALLTLINRYEQVCVVGDVNVQHNLPFAIDHLPALWLSVNEQMKSLDTVTKIWDFLFANDMTRRGLLIAVGGGVLTDVAGFAAATYKRGMDYINIPILAQFYPAKGFAIKAGVQPGFLVRASYDGHSFSDACEKFDFSIPVGLSYEYESFVFDARYNIGLTKTIKGAPEKTKNSVFQITFGYKFAL